MLELEKSTCSVKKLFIPVDKPAQKLIIHLNIFLNYQVMKLNLKNSLGASTSKVSSAFNSTFTL